jgi:hypothetical protein
MGSGFVIGCGGLHPLVLVAPLPAPGLDGAGKGSGFVINIGGLQPLLVPSPLVAGLDGPGLGSGLVCNTGGLQPRLLTDSMLAAGLTDPGMGSGLVSNCGGLQPLTEVAAIFESPESSALPSSDSTDKAALVLRAMGVFPLGTPGKVVLILNLMKIPCLTHQDGAVNAWMYEQERAP